MSEYVRARGGMGAFQASEFATDGATAQAADGPANYNFADADRSLRDLQTQINRWSGTYGFRPVVVDGIIGPATVAAARAILAHMPSTFSGFNASPDAQYLAMFSVEYASAFKTFAPGVTPAQVLPGRPKQAGFSMDTSTLAIMAAGAFFMLSGKKGRKSGKKGRKSGKKRAGKRRRR